MTKPYAPSSDENKEPILSVLREVLAGSRRVLEIGSGTGQHAVYLGLHLPHLVWLPSDLPENLPGIRQWLEEADLPNVTAPLALDVNDADWPAQAVDAVFSANTAHIMDWASVGALFAGVGRVLGAGGVFALYGPFHYGGQATSPSNARFDASLRARDPAMGVRNFEDVDALAHAVGLRLLRDYPMPVNNRTLVWEKAGP
ncbi:MAG: class I SAM-dependent methyltransferase [Gammaproteobacteria bacterium]|nr:class I SAM-dependent methyltransferase [Gammaproteobacteria bacterium]